MLKLDFSSQLKATAGCLTFMTHTLAVHGLGESDESNQF